MDLLKTAVVDIAMLVSTVHALTSEAFESDSAMQPKLRHRLRREIRRGTLVYIDTLARTRQGRVDDALLAACRVAAERRMTRAIGDQDRLRRIMARAPGSLDGLAAARQDLWRLAHLVICLRIGALALQDAGGSVDVEFASALAGRLRRRLRSALTAYAKVTLRANGTQGRLIGTARAAAWAEIGKRGAAEAERLADIEAGVEAGHGVIRRGVSQALLDLSLDWRRPDTDPA